jgi:2-(1,2-epoxy-1,2-dihydrophenyl)acetyl-CoA isomerase
LTQHYDKNTEGLVETKLIATREDAVVVITLNRPEVYNALDLEMVKTLAEKLTEVGSDETVRAVIITGAGKAFCAGGDLKLIQSSKGEAAGIHQLVTYFHQGVREIRRMNKPVVAAINGVAAGGGFSLALACDFRVMARSAILRQAYTSSGLCLDGGSSFTLPRLVGLARSMEIVAFDKPMDSEQSLKWGLVTQVVEDEEVLDAARKMAATLAEGSAHAYGACKGLLTDSFNTPLEPQLENEGRSICTCAAHSDAQEGIQAFLEKRKPVFRKD